jgi:predicted regulator of Ras-like GTPase activity (Roadblock/LC7/MglB family)
MLYPVDAQQALADLTEISSQIQAAVVFDDTGKTEASTLTDEQQAGELASGAARLLEEASGIKLGAQARLTQLEVATDEGSVFVVADGKQRIAATTGPNPTVGLVFYDLKSALRSISAKPPAKRRAPAKKPAAAKKPAPKKPAAERKKPAPRRTKPDAP